MEECCEKAKFIRYKNENYKKNMSLPERIFPDLKSKLVFFLLPYFLLHVLVLLLGFAICTRVVQKCLQVAS